MSGMSGNATSISALPTDPATGGSMGGNVIMTTVERTNVIDSLQQELTNNMAKTVPVSNPRNQEIELSQSTIQELVSGIKEATSSGAGDNLSLPDKDIPMDNSKIMHDETVKANYVPRNENSDYITDYEENENIVREVEEKKKSANSMERLFDELQAPIIVGIFYFLFQVPIFKKYERKVIPGLFNSDGNMNITGYIFNSILIAMCAFISRRVLDML